MPLAFRLFATAALSLFATAVPAAEVVRVDVHGLDEAMTDNVRASLSLVEAIGTEVSGRRLAYLVRAAEEEAREALEPFGYYAPSITVQRGEARGGVRVTITVEPGPPVRVRESMVAIEGEGGDDRYLREELDEFRPQVGDVFSHPVYEASKSRISRRLAERGYFDADFVSRRVEVSRAERSADIDLVWTSGSRYDMGPVEFVQQPWIVRESLLENLVYWEEGSYYHQGKLDRLRRSLVRLDYFSTIDIRPYPEQAQDGRVPVKVELTPAKPSVYTAGLSYGTDSGAGVRLGVERRYINNRGHKGLAEIDWAEYRKTLTLQYRIPAFAWLDGWYTVSAQAADEQTDYIDNRRIELVASRSGEIGDYWTAHASVHALRERWCYRAEAYCEREVEGVRVRPDYRYATFTYPSLRGEYVNADDLLYPRDAIGGSVLLRGGVEGAGSDTNFLQTRATANFYRGIGERNRIIARAELGYTLSDANVGALPPSLRFHAGGDRSIRGYAWREVGPRIRRQNPDGTLGPAFPVGARKVVTGSVEFERYFNESWGAAVFVDSGSAFNDSPEWRTGVGAGVRWRSPVGPVRVDIAHGLDDPDSSFQLHFNIGADL